MKTPDTTSFRSALLLAPTLFLVSCAATDHPLTRHDSDGDGFISHPEYQQSFVQYDVAAAQRRDEMGRARQPVRHLDNIGDGLYQANRALRLLKNLGN